MYIKYQKIKRNEDGVIISGSASLIKSTYVPNTEGDRTKHHAIEEIVMKLGTVIWRNEENTKQGIFDSPTFGLVYYDADKEEASEVKLDDPRLLGTNYQIQFPRIHTTFGNSYLFFSVMEKTGYMNILRRTFSNNALYQKVVAHIAHDCLKNGSFIKCGDFIKDDILSHVLTDLPMSTLDCDSSYYYALHDDALKCKFFKELIVEMRKKYPNYGCCCYVDSTPLPGEAENNPFNALSSHGTDGAKIQCRLVLILDIETHVPVWFSIIPANVLDMSTIQTVINDVKSTLDVDIDVFDLDAGYARRELFELFNRNSSTYIDKDGIKRDHTVLVRMPASNGYPYDDLYIKAKPHFFNPDYLFAYEGHTYYGERFEVTIFDQPMYAFVFVDKTQADELLRGWLYSNMDDWNTMSHSAREWYQVKNGFFILLGNKDQTPFQAIVEYRGRTHIEAVFRDGKSYLKILPISKWTNETVTGKILHDIIEIIFYREYRKNVANAHLPMSKLIVQMSSWQCILEGNTVNTWPPKKQVREIMEAIGFNALSHYNLVDMRNEILNGIPMAREPIKHKRKRKIESQCIPISPEEKKEASENKKRDNEAKNQAKAAERQAAREAKAAERQAAREAKAAEKQAAREAKAAERQAAREAKAAERQAAREAKAAERQTARKAKDAKQPEVS